MDGLEAFYDGFVEAALWSTTDNSTASGGVPFDQNYGPEDLTEQCAAAMRKDCEDFLEAHKDVIGENYYEAGVDFWLSRSGHGAGFFDSSTDYHGHEQALQKAARVYGTFELTLGDDEKIHGG